MLIFTPLFICIFFFFNDTATTEIYTLSLHDALPILGWSEIISIPNPSLLCMTLTERMTATAPGEGDGRSDCAARSEEHTSELQSRLHLVCRLLLEKKKQSCDTLIASLAQRMTCTRRY